MGVLTKKIIGDWELRDLIFVGVIGYLLLKIIGVI